MKVKRHDTTRVTVSVSEKNYKWLEQEAKNSGMSYSSLVAFALDTYITQRQMVDVMGNLIKKVEALEAKEGVKSE